MPGQVTAITKTSAREIQEALATIKNKPSKRKITGLKIRNGELVIVHSPA